MGTCRFCLGSAEMNIFFEDRKVFFQKFLVFTKLKIYKNDGFPQQICLVCLQKLEAIVEFITQCEESDRTLRLDIKPPPITIYNEFIDDLKSFTVDDDNYDSHNDDSKSTHSSDGLEDMFDMGFSDSELSKLDKKVKKEPKEKLILEKANYLCNICGEHFDNSQRHDFTRHMTTHREKKFKCDKCPRKFSQKNFYDNHMMLHATGQFTCKYCNKQFTEARRAKLHMLYIHQKTMAFKCQICPKSYNRPESLRQHTKTHTATKKNYTCDFCGKIFYSKQGLIVHVRNHTGERPFSCRFCESQFSNLGYLKEHERLHTGETPFKCPICLKGFAQRGNMKSHFKFNHRESNYKESMTLYKKTEELLKSSSGNEPTLKA